MDELVAVAIEEVALDGREGELCCAVNGGSLLRAHMHAVAQLPLCLPPCLPPSLPWKGCSIRRLWELLEARLPLCSVSKLTPGIKQYLWTCLLARPEDIGLFSPDQLLQGETDSGYTAKNTPLCVQGYL